MHEIVRVAAVFLTHGSIVVVMRRTTPPSFVAFQPSRADRRAPGSSRVVEIRSNEPETARTAVRSAAWARKSNFSITPGNPGAPVWRAGVALKSLGSIASALTPPRRHPPMPAARPRPSWPLSPPPSGGSATPGADPTHSSHAILEVRPEVDPQFPARLLETRERVPRLAAQLTPRAPADLPLLHVVPKMALAQIGVQRDLGPLQHPQQGRPVRLQALEHAVDVGITGALFTQRVEAGFQTRAPRRPGTLPIHLEIVTSQ